jgi:hypothetical protein
MLVPAAPASVQAMESGFAAQNASTAYCALAPPSRAMATERARAAGAVRSDVTVEDVRVGLAAIASFRALRPERAAASTHRLVGLLLAGLAAPR